MEERALAALVTLGAVWALLRAQAPLAGVADWLTRNAVPASRALLVAGASLSVPAFVLGAFTLALAALVLAVSGALMSTILHAAETAEPNER